MSKKAIGVSPNSFDINLAELVIGELKNKIKERNPQTKLDLVQIAKEEWEKMDQIQIQHYINKIQQRLQEIIKCDGDYTEKIKQGF